MSLLSPVDVDSLAHAALAAVQTEYPHRLDQELHADADLLPPRRLNPCFYGSYDWHSAVHNHWLLVVALERGLPDATAADVEAVLDRHLRPDRVAGEITFFSGPGGRTAERPYGWTWLVALYARCATGGHRWAEALRPLATLLGGQLDDYFDGTLAFPIRSGTHRNSAFNLRLLQQAGGNVAGAARRLFASDRRLGWDDDPSGDAFLDPALTEAALLADVLDTDELVAWLAAVMPGGPPAWAPPQFTPDGEDPGTVHLEGLLISRAWCLDALAAALPADHPIGSAAAAARDAHLARVAAIRPTDGFNRSHWLPTFLLYLDEQLRTRP